MNKKNIIITIVSVLILTCVFAFARTTTTNLGLIKPSWDEELDISTDLNANSDIIDAIFNDVSLTEFSYLDGVTSAIQTQLELRYLKTEMDTETELEAILTDVTNLYTNNDFNIADYLLIANKYTDVEAVTAIKADASWHAANWDLAYGWGDHSVEGYLKNITAENFADLADIPAHPGVTTKVLETT